MSATRDTQSTDEFFKVDIAALVGIEDVEDILGEFSGITEWEELFVYSGEFRLVEPTRRTVFLETLVPGSKISL